MAADKRSIISVFIEQASKYPSNVAIEDDNTLSTFDELLNQVKKLSRLVWQHLAKTSLPPESRFVCVLLPQGRLFLQSALSVLGAGGVCVPLGTGSTPSELEFVLTDLGHPLLITQENILQEKKFTYDNCHMLSNDWQDDIDNSNLSCNDFTFQENEFAFAYFTSESTGQPKAILHRHHIFLMNVYMKQEMMSLSSDDKSCLFLNPAFILSTQEMWPVLLSGGRLVVAPPHLRHDIREFRKWVKKLDISILTLVSSMAVAFYTQTTHFNEFSESLRWVCCGGESLHKMPPDTLPFLIWFFYGATETAEIAFNVLQKDKAYANSSNGKIPVGRAIDGYDILIVSENLELVPDGVVGEVCVAGEQLGSYVNRQELMAQKFVSLCGQRAYRTGDLGYKNADGVLFLADRMDNMVKLSGHKFEVGELETILCKHPSIHKAVAVVQKNSDQPKIHVFYTLKTEVRDDLPERLYDFLKNKIPHYAFPASFHEIQTIPLNSNGKTDKQKLLSLLSETEMTTESTKTENEKNLVRIWSKVLQIPTSKIRTNDHFFGLGGSSIQIGEILELIKTSTELSTNVELTAAKFFAHPTIKRFSFYLDHPQDCELKKEVNQVNLLDELATYEDLIQEIVLPKVESQFGVGEGGILLTGATGYFGSSLLLRLLQKYPCRPIYCLVRANSPNDAEARVLYNMRRFGISPPIISNCVFLTGNISHPFLGLAEQDYNGLSKSIGEIFHTAAEVHFLKDYEFLKASNVQGMIEILKFASQNRLKVLNYMSTLGIFGFVRSSVDGVISENIMPEFGGTKLGYEQTKCMAENIAYMGKKKGIPTRIFRLGVIGPHSIEKIYNPNDFLLLLLQASMFLQSFPTLDWKFPFTTLDFAVEGILTLASHAFEENDLKTFHIFQKEVTLEAIGSILASGRQMGQLAPSEWFTLLLKAGDSHSQLRGVVQVLSKPFHSGLTFLQLPHNEGWNFENKETLRAIQNSGSEKLIISDEVILNSIVDCPMFNS